MSNITKRQLVFFHLSLLSLVFSCRRKNHVEPEPANEQIMILANVSGVYDKYVIALDGATGVEKWRLQNTSEWIIADRNLYVNSRKVAIVDNLSDTTKLFKEKEIFENLWKVEPASGRVEKAIRSQHWPDYLYYYPNMNIRQQANWIAGIIGETVIMNWDFSDNSPFPSNTQKKIVYATDLNTGALKWSMWPYSGNTDHVPLVLDNKLYMSHYNFSEASRRLDPGTGKVIGEIPITNANGSFFRNGVLYASLGNEFVAYDEAAGVIRWKVPLFASTCVMDFKRFAPDNSTIYVGGCGKISALDMQTGKQKWLSQVATDWNGQEVAGMATLNGLVIMATREKIYAVEAATGKLKWALELMSESSSIVLSSLFVGGGLIYVDKGNDLYAIDQTGKIKWNVKPGEIIGADHLFLNFEVFEKSRLNF